MYSNIDNTKTVINILWVEKEKIRESKIRARLLNKNTIPTPNVLTVNKQK